MHEYHSQHRVLTLATLPLRFSHSSGTFYIAFRDPGQILIIRDCPGDSGTVGAYEICSWDTQDMTIQKISNLKNDKL